MYKIAKTQGKIVYIRCIDITNLLKILNSLIVLNRENSNENWRTYQIE